MAIICFAAVAFGQDDSTTWHKHEAWDWIRFHRTPSLTLSYGFVQTGLDGLSQSLYSPRSFELRLGGMRQDLETKSEYVVQHRNDYLSVGVATKDLGGEVKAREIGFTTWTAGLGWERGYGYKFTSANEGPAIHLLVAHGVQWGNLALKGGISNGPDSTLMESYEGGIRFSTKSGGVIRFHILPLLALDAGYERMVMYRKHKFWEWLGSVIVEGSGEWVIDRFVDRILSTSPGAAPIVNFVLKNAVSYGVYELRKKNGSWPFESEAPMTYDTFRVGITMVF
jgi:hypothetical protein